MNTLRKIEELIEQNKNLEHRNEELKKIIEINLTQSDYDECLASLHDIVDVSEAENLLVKFYQHNKIPTALFDHTGKLIFSIGWKPACTKYHRGNDNSLIQCDETFCLVNQKLAENQCYLYQCKNGMNAIAFPVEIHHKHIATIILSQFFYKDEAPDYIFFKELAKKFKFDSKAYISAIKELPTYSNSEIDCIIKNGEFLAEIIGYLIFKNLEYKNRSKKIIDNKMLLSTLRDKIKEEENIIKSLLHDITNHEKEIKENTVSRAQFLNQQKRLNDKLERSEDLLNSLLSSVPLGIAFVQNNVLTYVNDKIIRITGYNTKELIGRNPEFLFRNPDDYQKICPDTNMMSDTKPFEIQLKRKDGSSVEVFLYATLLNKSKPSKGSTLSIMDLVTIKGYQHEFLHR
jgi:PAS domain S-box-containing protein